MPDSHRPLSVALQFSTDAGLTVDVPVYNYLQSLTVEEVAKGAWKMSIELFDIQREAGNGTMDNVGGYIEGLILASPPTNRIMTVAFGYVGETQQTFRGRIISYDPDISPEGILLRLELLPDVLAKATTDKPILAFPVGKAISEIVREIAVKMGWNTTDDKGVDLIEATKGASAEPFNSTGESAFTFIDRILRPLAQSQNSGEGDYKFYVDHKNGVHFHTCGHKGAEKYTFMFRSGQQGLVQSFKPKDNGLIAAAYMGGAGAVARSTNNQEGKAERRTTDDNSGPSGKPPSSTADATTVPQKQSDNAAHGFAYARTPEEAEAIAQTVYDSMRKLAYPAELVTIGFVGVHPMDQIDVQYYTRSGGLHYLSGTFVVYNVKHEISDGKWTTSYDLRRTGTSLQGAKGTASTTGQDTTAPAGDAGGTVSQPVRPA